MFLARRRPVYSHWSNYGCLTINIATMTGMSDAQQNAYLAVVKQAYPPTPGVAQWVRNTRYAIPATTGTPDWNTTATRYWPNMYARAAASDIMTGRKIMFEPILWIRQAAGSFMLNPNAAPNYFGRNSSGAIVVAEGSDTWRRDIRLNLDRLMWSDVGTTGGEPFVTNAKITNFSNLILIGPNEIDAWTNARWYYLVDDEAGASGAAYLAATRAETALSGAAGLNTLLLRIYDHQRHMFAWAREKRPDVGLLFPSVIDVVSSGSREFTIFNVLQFTHTGAGLTAQGVVNDVCDGHQIHPHMYQSVIPNPWTGGVPSTTHISCYWYWKANEAVQAWRLANSLPDNTRPLFSTETGQDYIGSGAVTTGRTDLFQLRRLKYGMLVLGQLYYGVCMINFYAVGRSAATGFNTIDPADDTTYWGGAAPNRDADFAFRSLDMRETSDLIPFVAKPWQDYWKDWQVWIQAPQQDPIDGGPSVCPFVEWNRVVMAGTTVTMNAGGRNIVARKKNVKRGVHTFSAEVRLTASGSGAALRVSGHDKLNGLNLISSSVLSGVQDWTPLSVSFTPRQHGNRRLPDPAYAVLMIDHNGVGTCEVRNPTISVGGAIPIELYFDVQVMDVVWSPTNPVAGNAVTFSVLVKNIGNQATPSGVIHGCRFDVGGTMVSWTDNVTTALQPDEERWQTANGGPSGSSTWTAVLGQHAVLATFDDANRMPAERFKTNNTMSKTVTVAAQTGPTVPPQAAAAGLTNLFFNHDFTALSLYNQVTNPSGIWRCNDFYQNAEHAGYVDLAGRRTFMINQTMRGVGTDTYSNLAAFNAIQPYLPISQLDSTTMRITARRARLSERPALRTVINAIAVNTQSQPADTVTWLGAFLTTEKVHPYAPADINRPAYVECRVRFSPANTNGIFSAFWLYDTSEVSGSPEIDIFETNDLTPAFWKTNIHHSQTGPSFNLQHNSTWNDGQFHTFGMLWEANSLKIYRDNVLSQSLTGANAAYFNMPMRLMITHTVDPHWAAGTGMLSPATVEQVYADFDFVRVWTAGGPQATPAEIVANRGHLSNVSQSSGTIRDVVWRSAFWTHKASSVAAVRLLFANSYLDATGEHPGLNTIYVTASVEYNGVTVPATFGGVREVFIAPGGTAVTDSVVISIPSNTMFWTRQNVRTASAGEKYPTGYLSNSNFGEGFSNTNTVAQVDTTGVLTGNSQSNLFCPVAVIAGSTDTATEFYILAGADCGAATVRSAIASANCVAVASASASASANCVATVATSATAGANGAAVASASASASANCGVAVPRSVSTGADASVAIVLQSSGPITTTANGQTIENKIIHATGHDYGIAVGHQNVTIRNCKIYHDLEAGIAAGSNFAGLLIEDCWVICETAPAAGQNPSDAMCNIILWGDNAPPSNVIVRRVKLEKGSTGIYARYCVGLQCSYVEGYDFRGPFPRGQVAQFSYCTNSILEDFSCENTGDTSYTEDCVNMFACTDPVVRRGFIKGNNSPAGQGMIVENGVGGSGGSVTDVDVVFWQNGAFSAADGATNVTFTRCRARDGIAPAATSTSAGLTAYDGSTIPTKEQYEAPYPHDPVLSGQEAFQAYIPATATIAYVDCYYWTLPRSPNLAWDQNMMSVTQFTQQNFTPRAPIRNTFSWIEP